MLTPRHPVLHQPGVRCQAGIRPLVIHGLRHLLERRPSHQPRRSADAIQAHGQHRLRRMHALMLRMPMTRKHTGGSRPRPPPVIALRHGHRVHPAQVPMQTERTRRKQIGGDLHLPQPFVQCLPGRRQPAQRQTRKATLMARHLIDQSKLPRRPGPRKRIGRTAGGSEHPRMRTAGGSRGSDRPRLHKLDGRKCLRECHGLTSCQAASRPRRRTLPVAVVARWLVQLLPLMPFSERHLPRESPPRSGE